MSNLPKNPEVPFLHIEFHYYDYFKQQVIAEKVEVSMKNLANHNDPWVIAHICRGELISKID